MLENRNKVLRRTFSVFGLHQQNDSGKTLVGQISKSLKDLKDSLDAWRQQRGDLEGKLSVNDFFAASVQDQMQARKEIQNVVVSLREELDETKQELDETKQVLDETKQANVEIEAENRSLKQLLQSRDDKIALLQTELDKVKHSRQSSGGGSSSSGNASSANEEDALMRSSPPKVLKYIKTLEDEKKTSRRRLERSQKAHKKSLRKICEALNSFGDQRERCKLVEETLEKDPLVLVEMTTGVPSDRNFRVLNAARSSRNEEDGVGTESD